MISTRHYFFCLFLPGMTRKLSLILASQHFYLEFDKKFISCQTYVKPSSCNCSYSHELHLQKVYIYNTIMKYKLLFFNFMKRFCFMISAELKAAWALPGLRYPRRLIKILRILLSSEAEACRRAILAGAARPRSPAGPSPSTTSSPSGPSAPNSLKSNYFKSKLRS
jgi:hypothetical protein